MLSGGWRYGGRDQCDTEELINGGQGKLHPIIDCQLINVGGGVMELENLYLTLPVSTTVINRDHRSMHLIYHSGHFLSVLSIFPPSIDIF